MHLWDLSRSTKNVEVTNLIVECRINIVVSNFLQTKIISRLWLRDAMIFVDITR